jgi:hypothetical protein
MVAILWVVGVAACFGLCAYGINAAVRRARARRDTQAPGKGTP